MKQSTPLHLLYALLCVAPVAVGLLIGLFLGALREVVGPPMFDAPVSSTVLFLAYLIPAVAALCYLYSRRAEINQIIQDQADRKARDDNGE